MSQKGSRTPPELEDVAAQIGDFIEYWGFKNVHGRIWAHIFLAEEPLDAAQLIERLGISKALVSMSISDLLEYDVIQVAGKSDHATVVYRSNPNITNVITNILRKRERRMLSRINSAVRLLKEMPIEQRNNVALSENRITALSEMVQSAEATLDGVLQLAEVSFQPWGQFNHIPDPEEPQDPKS